VDFAVPHFGEQVGVVFGPAVFGVDDREGLAVGESAGDQERGVRFAATGASGYAEEQRDVLAAGFAELETAKSRRHLRTHLTLKPLTLDPRRQLGVVNALVVSRPLVLLKTGAPEVESDVDLAIRELERSRPSRHDAQAVRRLGLDDTELEVRLHTRRCFEAAKVESLL
jgi:hypothetical protein